MKNSAINILLGVAVGDALGVPYEFSERDKMKYNPATDMIGFRTHNQPPGTWSDDSSLTFCLAEAMVNGYDLKRSAINFIKWRNEAYWTAEEEVFDIGMTTNKAISRLQKILISNRLDDLATLKLHAEESDNGNGSLMRILPLIFEIKGKNSKLQFDMVWENSALTHRHIRAAMSCMIYLKLAENILDGLEKLPAYKKTKQDIALLWDEIDFPARERVHFYRIIQDNIYNAHEDTIMSGGYVIEALEASLWSFLKTDSYKNAVLKVINFGHDTDTTGAITGGLAGLYYGIESVPKPWIDSLARLDDIINLAQRLNIKYANKV